MGKGKTFTKQFKENAVKYKKEHPELTLLQAASNLGVSLSALKHWIAAAKENEGAVPTRGTGNFSSDEAKEIARLEKELRDTKDPLINKFQSLTIYNETLTHIYNSHHKVIDP